MDSKANANTAWRRIRRNIGVLLGERAVFAVVNFAAAAIAARAVGVEALGAVGLLLAYSRLISDVMKFNSWQSVLRYGAPLLEAGEMRSLRRLLGLTLWVDIGAILVAVAGAVALAPLAGKWLNWSEEMIRYAPWFCVIIAFITHMTPTGILRLFDKVPYIAAMHAITATLRFAGAAAIWTWGGGLFELAVVWTVSAAVAALVVWTLAAVEAVRRQATPRMAGALREGAEGFDRFWRFIGATNVISTLDKIVFHVATLIVGAVLGPFEAGLFYIVRQITEAMVRPGDMLGPLFFPEIALLEAKGDRRAMRRLVKRAMIYSGMILGAVVLALVVFGEILLALMFGDEARAAYEVLVLAGVASALLVWGFTLEPTLLTIGKAGQALYAAVAAWVVFGAMTWLLIEDYELIGVGLAMIGHRATQFLLRFAFVARHLAKSRL